MERALSNCVMVKRWYARGCCLSARFVDSWNLKFPYFRSPETETSFARHPPPFQYVPKGMLIECTQTSVLSSPLVSLLFSTAGDIPCCYLRVRGLFYCRGTTCESKYYMQYITPMIGLLSRDGALVCCCRIQSPPFFRFRFLTPRDVVFSGGAMCGSCLVLHAAINS